MTSLALRSANLLLLISALLVQVCGSLMQIYSPSWGLLLTEFMLILAPVLLLLRSQRLPLSETLALRWPGAGPVLLGALTGLGTFAAGTLVAGFTYSLLGYTPRAAANPTTPAGALVMLVALTVAAPLCEEVLFRGYLFNAYLERGARVAVIAVALLFAGFHMRLAGLPALLPVAFALSFVRWRSDSVLPGIALHMVNNFTGGGIGLLRVMTGHAVPMNLQTLEVCLAIGAVALLLFSRTVRRPTEAGTAVTAARLRLWPTAWPLAAFACIYVGIAMVEVLASNSGRPLQLAAPADWSQPHRWRYEVRDAVGQKTGELDCLLEPAVDTIALTCTGRAGVTSATWRRSDLQLLAQSAPGGAPGEWPWRLTAYHFTKVGTTTVTNGMQKAKLNVLSTTGSMHVLNRDYTTTVVRLGENAEATYAGHMLLRYANATETYIIISAE